MNKETITITKEEYFNLRKDSLKLNFLEAGGVDNWQWYDESLWPEGGNDIGKAEKELSIEIFGNADKVTD